MKKIRNFLFTMLLVPFLALSSNAMAVKEADSLEEIAETLPSLQKQWLENAISAAKKGETEKFLLSEEGKYFTNFLNQHPDLGEKIIKSTKAYKYLQTRDADGLVGEDVVFSDGSAIYYSNKTTGQGFAPSGVIGGWSVVYANDNKVTYELVAGSATCNLETKYQYEVDGDRVRITDVTPSAKATGFGVQASYNADKKIYDNETTSPSAEASFTLAYGFGGGSGTDTVYHETYFKNKKPYHRNS